MNIHTAICAWLENGSVPEREIMAKVYLEIKAAYGVDRLAIKSRSRKRHISLARHAFCFIMCTKGRLDYSSVARELGRHHSVVMNSVAVIKDIIEVTPAEKERIDNILLKL